VNKSKVEPFLESERKNTDESLGNERDKTNESLSVAREQTERSTDNKVQAERTLTDQVTTSSRIQADSERENQRVSLSAASNAVQDAGQLHDERRSADRATERERSQVDAALEKERELKNALVSRFLEQEREQTDENLSLERSRTDSKVEQGMTLLSAEVAGHLKTKTSLTTRDEFIAIVSHDLKNPIGAVSTCADMLLEDDYPKKLDAETRTWIEFMKRNADMSLRLINDLLDMERVAEGKLQLEFGRHDIGRIIRESVESHALLASAKSILLRIMPANISGDVLCDRDRVAQVVSNLISNAIKFTPEGGSITVNANFQENEVQVSVRDTGPGIPDNKKEQIFERFVQLSSNDRRGLGLGLHISKMLVEAHQGRLWVQSKCGEGSTFIFALPKLQPKNERVVEKQKEKATTFTNGIRI
jgi:signal transduction histidine kinase